jgi:hypothetical protein
MRRFHDVSTSLGGREITLMQQQHTDLCWLERQVLYYTTNRLKLLLNRSCLMAENTTGTPSFARRGASVKLRYSALHAYHILSRCTRALLRSNDSLVSAASIPIWMIVEPSAVCMSTYLQKEGQRTLLVHFIIPSSDSS